MIQRILFIMALFILFAASPVNGQQSLEKVQPNVTQAKSVKADVRVKAGDLSRDRQEMIQEILYAKYRLARLKYHQEKTRQYIAHAKQSIEDLEYKKVEYYKMQEQLKPYLNGVILRLEDFVAHDLPFLTSERENRINVLKNSMDDDDLPLSKKLRRVFEEGLQIETEYGKMVEAIEGETLNIDDIDTQVIIFLLGRVGMYYMSLDGTKTGFYNRVTSNWEPLPNSMNQKIKLAIKIGQRERTVEIVTLPLQNLGDVR